MKPKILITSAIFLMVTIHHAYSADVVWSQPQDISSASEVNTQGTLEYAKSFGSAATTVNGVTFGNPSGYSDDFEFTFTGFMGTTTFIGTNDSAGQGYATILNSGRYVQAGALTRNFTLSNLTVGRNYLVQFWVADYRANIISDRSATISGGSNTSGLLYYADGDNSATGIHGSYVIGNFTADTTSQVFNLVANVDVQISAVQLRSLTNPTENTLTITSFSRQSSGDYIIDFVGSPSTQYKVTKSPNLITAFEPLTNPVVEVMTDSNGRGTATVLASEASEAKEFYRIEQ